jgi:hypothetical protein
MKKYLIGLSVGLFTVIANAQFISNKALIEADDNGNQGQAFAIGYVLGVVDSFDGTMFCTPEGIKSGELKSIIVDALRKFPEMGKQTAADSVIAGFSAAFPCQGQKQGQRLL